MKKLFVLITVVFLLAACGAGEPPATATPSATNTPIPPSPTPICEVQATEFENQMQDIIERWDDTTAIAGSTGRGALSGPVGDLQEIKREAGDLEPPPCAEHIKELMGVYMERYINAYLSFMSQESDSAVNSQFQFASEAFDDLTEAITAIGLDVSD